MIRQPILRTSPRFNLHRLVGGIVLGFYSILFHPGYLQASDNANHTHVQAPWQVSADRIIHDQQGGGYVAEGHVVVSRNGQTLNADEVHFDQLRQEALAIGNVRLVSGKDFLTGRRLRLNLESETGEVDDGLLFVSENHLYLSGDHIRKTGPQTYTADRFTATACKGPAPDWKFTGRDLKVTIEGYGFAKHIAFWAGKVPLLYSPYFIFPVKRKRQSGLLVPELGYSSRLGAYYLQPLFWAINDQSDATLYAHYMTERGVRTGLEFRYMLSNTRKGALFVEGFTDRQIDDGAQDNSEKWGYDDDDALRPNEDRYWIRMKHDHDLLAGVTLKLDLDVVSDQDYLHEFKDDYNGFTATQNYFRGTFGRDIDDEIDPIRTNRLNVSRIWHHYALNADLQWYDDIIKRRQSDTDDTLHELPLVTLDGAQQPIGSWPLYYDISSSYIHFYSEDNARGQRLNLSPRIYLPMRWFGSLTVSPSVGANLTAWSLDRDENGDEPVETEFYRGLYDLKIDTNAEFYRLFKVSMGKSDHIKHAILPQISYTYIPDRDQTDLPEFDDLDRIDASNFVTYSLINTLTARYANKTENGRTDFNYHTFLRFKLSQSFDMNKQREDDPEPFSDIQAELDIMPGRFGQLDFDGQWSIYEDALTSYDAVLSLWDNRGDRLTAGYHNQRESAPGVDDGSESINLETELKITGQWRLRGYYERNLYNHKDIQTKFGFSYQPNCWSLDFDYIKEEDDERYSVTINLLSLGGMTK